MQRAQKELVCFAQGAVSAKVDLPLPAHTYGLGFAN
jgi:hypothetical protein